MEEPEETQEQQKSLSKHIVAFAVGELQQEIIQLNENSKHVMAKVVNLICGRFQTEVQTALQQNQYCAQQKLILISRIEQQQVSLSAMQEDNETLRTELDSLIATHNQYLEQLDQSQSELDHGKHLLLEQQQAQHLLHRHIEHFQASVDSLEEDNTLLREQLDKERSKNKYLEGQFALFEVKYIEISQLYESQQERNDQLSSSISHHDEKIRRLQRKIEEQDYIQSFTPDLQINSDNNVSLQQKKTLREEEPNIRLSQSQDTFFCPPLPLSNIGKARQLKSSREIQIKNDINSSLRKTLNKSKMMPISHQKKPSSVHSKPEAAFTKRSIKEQPEKVSVKDKLKQIFMDRVKYKIDNDLKHHRQIDSLRCKLRAKENQKSKLQKQLDQIKQTRSPSRAGSMVLGRKTKQKSRKSSRCEPQGLWLQSQLKDCPRKGESSLLNKSNEGLSQQKSEFECSPRAALQNYEQQFELNKEKQFSLKKEDEFQEFNLIESRNSHHYLNLEIDIQQDISFKHEDPNLNESHSLSRSGNFGKRQRYPSICSNRGSELLMYQDGSLREDPLEEEHEKEERSPALMRFLIQGERQNRKTFQQEINFSMQQKFEADRIQVTSSPNTQRKADSISQFHMFFNQGIEGNIKICSLGNLAQIIPKPRQLKCFHYYKQKIEPSPPPKKIFKKVQNLNFSVIGFSKQSLGIQTDLYDVSDRATQTLAALLQQKNLNTDPLNLISEFCQTIPRQTCESETNTYIPLLKHVRTPTIQVHQVVTTTDDKEVQWSKQNSMMTQQTEIIETSIQAQAHGIEIGWNYGRRKLQHQRITNLTVLPSKREPKLGLYYPLIFSYSEKRLRKALKVNQIQDLKIQGINKQRKFDILNYLSSKIEVKKKAFNCVLQKAVYISIDGTKSKKTLQRQTSHNISIKLQKERTQFSLSSYFSLSLQPKSKDRRSFVSLESLNVQCLKMRKELICVHSTNIMAEFRRKPMKLDYQKQQSVIHYRTQKRDFSTYCQLNNPQLKLQSEIASFVFRPCDNVLLSGSSDFHSADQWKSLSFQSIDYHDLVLQNHKVKDMEDLSSFPSKDISKSSIKTKSFVNKIPLTPKPHLTSQNDKFEKANYKMQKSMASSQATNVKNCSPFTCSNFNTPQLQKSILSQVDHQQSEEQSLKKHFCNIGSLHLLESSSKALFSQMKFKVDCMQVLICLKDGKSFKFAFHRGRVVMISPTVAAMQLPALKLNSIKHQNGILIMGNCELTIMGEKLTINRSSKFRIFKGEMPEGEWKICEIKIYQIKQSL